MEKHKCDTCKYYFKTEYFLAVKNVAPKCLKSKLQITGIVKECTQFKPKKI